MEKDFFVFDWDVKTPIGDVIAQAIFAAAMCWEHVEAAGEYNTEAAEYIIKELLEIMHRKSMRID